MPRDDVMRAMPVRPSAAERRSPAYADASASSVRLPRAARCAAHVVLKARNDAGSVLKSADAQVQKASDAECAQEKRHAMPMPAECWRRRCADVVKSEGHHFAAPPPTA
jgi:hypothetical protein